MYLSRHAFPFSLGPSVKIFLIPQKFSYIILSSMHVGLRVMCPFLYTLTELQFSQKLLGKPRINFQENPFIGSHFVARIKIQGLKNKKRRTVQS
jgi:hypothetical protein